MVLELLRLGFGLWEPNIICKDSKRKNGTKGCGSFLGFSFSFFEKKKKNIDEELRIDHKHCPIYFIGSTTIL